MNDLAFRTVDSFPEPAFTALSRQAFSDYEPSQPLTDVLAVEDAAFSGSVRPADAAALRIAVFRGATLVAWTYARPAAGRRLEMVNSGVAPAERRRGIYSQLVGSVIEHARSHGHVAITSRHAANNNAVIVAKLKLGFFVSGYGYSEVYGPLVGLAFLVGDLRRALHNARSRPIRRIDADDAR